MKLRSPLLALFAAIAASACSTHTAKQNIASPPQHGIVKAVNRTDVYYAKCKNETKPLEQILSPIVRSMVAQKIPYSQSKPDQWLDCSGNFLRLSSYIAEQCPEQQNSVVAPPGVRDYVRGGKNRVPGPPKARTAREIARWYSQRGRFTPIYYDGSKPTQGSVDLRVKRHLVKVGSVLWFAKSAPKSDAKLAGVISSIKHMAVVTSVIRDSKGNVIQVKMYHGRNKGKLAKETTEHYWVWPDKYLLKGKKYPPLGYWGQYLVAIGPILPVEGDPNK